MPSIVSKHFKKVGNKAVCDCGKEISLGKSGTTTGCLDHLNTEEHKEAMRRKEGGPSAPKKAKVESVATLFSPNYCKQKSQQLISDLTDFIVDSNLPFSITESPYLRRLIKGNYGQAKLSSRHDVCTEVPFKAGKCIEDLRSLIQGQKLSLTLDEFSHREHSLLCITGSFFTEAFQFQSKVLAVEPFLEKHTGDNIAEKINEVMARLEVNKINVVAATRDGAPNLAGSKGGGCVKANIVSFHCFCHVLHLVVWNGINKTAIVSSVVEKAAKIGIGFHRTPTAMSSFREVQGVGSTTLNLQVKTKWNSTLDMLSSMLHHKTYLLKYAEKYPGCTVSKHIKDMSENDFEEIADIIQVLQPFKDCTKMASYQNAPISCYPFFVRKLSEHLENVYGEFAVHMNESLDARTKDLLNQTEVGIAAFLDLRLSCKLTVMPKCKWEYIKQEIVELLSKDATKSVVTNPQAPMQSSSGLWEEGDGELVQETLEGGDAVMEEINRYLNERRLPYETRSSRARRHVQLVDE